MAGVTVTDTFNASPDKVWAIVGDVGGISKWVPAMESSESTDGGKTRHCVLGGGMGEVDEVVTARDDAARSYSYAITKSGLPLQNYKSTITVNDAGGGNSEVVWSASFDPDIPAEEAEGMIKGLYESSLATLKTLL